MVFWVRVVTVKIEKKVIRDTVFEELMGLQMARRQSLGKC